MIRSCDKKRLGLVLSAPVQHCSGRPLARIAAGAFVPILIALVALLSVLCASGRAAAQAAPASEPLQGDGRVSSFYVWNEAVPPNPGVMLRTEPLPAVLGLAQAARQARILYSSTDGVSGTAPAVVSGALFEPRGMPPRAGWPLIAWAHGTVGVADICAPSWSARSYRDIAYLNAWLAHGFAVVATDYAGLGTRGGHPYLNVRSEAYSVLDSVRAALSHDKNLANNVVIVGQSQGGGAAFGTAAYAPQYAADVNVRGTVATGVPYFGPNVPDNGAPDPARVDPGIAYIFYIALMAQQTDRTLDPATLFTPAALPLFETARSACVNALEEDIKLEQLSDAKALLPAARALVTRHLAEFEYPTLALKTPVFIGTGTADTTVLPAVQRQLVKDSCAAGTIVEAHEYAGLSHAQTVNASLKDSLPFVQKVFAGARITPICSPIPQ